jgi:hypothetical protein
MSEANWHRARLIPISGVNGAQEQERRATSALLAVIGAVREFGRAVTAPLGAPTGQIEAFIQVPFSTVAGTSCSSDGLIAVTRRPSNWTALVTVKTGDGRLDRSELETYLDVAREQRFDAVLTISNETADGGRHPVAVDNRKLRTVTLHHYSWSHLLAEAVVQKDYRGVADPDQAWVLSELIRYLEHSRSGTLCRPGPEVIDLSTAMTPQAMELFTREPRAMELDEMESRTMDTGTVDTGTIESLTSVSRTVSVEPAPKLPMLPPRRDLRLVRRLETGTGAHPTALPEAGWYQDPRDGRQLRWYDGSAWSESTYPMQAALA